MGGSGYLHSEENRKILDRTIPIGKYEVELAILNSKTISKRVVGARLKIKNDKIIRYEQTQNKSSNLNGFGVDAGLASFCDVTVAEEYQSYLTKVSTVFKNELNQANEEFKKKMIDTAEKVEAQKEEITELKKELTSTKKLIFCTIGLNIFLAGAIIYLILK